MSEMKRNGEEATGEDCTLTRLAEGVVGLTSMFASKSRYFLVRANVYTAFVMENATSPHARGYSFW